MSRHLPDARNVLDELKQFSKDLKDLVEDFPESTRMAIYTPIIAYIGCILKKEWAQAQLQWKEFKAQL